MGQRWREDSSGLALHVYNPLGRKADNEEKSPARATSLAYAAKLRVPSLFPLLSLPSLAHRSMLQSRKRLSLLTLQGFLPEKNKSSKVQGEGKADLALSIHRSHGLGHPLAL